MNVKSALVRNYMARDLISFYPETDVLDAIHDLVTHRIAGAPVVDHHGELIGMLSELDCIKVALDASYYGQRGGPVSDYMTTEVKTVDAEMNIVDLAERFATSRFRRFPVLKDGRLVGQISRRDVLRALEDLST